VIKYEEISKKLMKQKAKAESGKRDKRASAPAYVCDDACDIMLAVSLA